MGVNAGYQFEGRSRRGIYHHATCAAASHASSPSSGCAFPLRTGGG